ncbi:uncharacterized protein LOC143363669 isoform X2 [Halictus rubicundus]|uniref:uncharacterized protein LOC143363669 isoform X2 n=1 Tax=Halictus rubicundus TaxID=77578 RepID=UPI004036338A
MSKPQTKTVMVKCYDNNSNLESEDARDDYANLNVLPIKENKVQYKLTGCNVPEENGKCRGRNNLDSYNVNHNEISKEQVSENTITLTRRIPNILKNSPKMHKVVKEPSNETVSVNMKENIQEAYNSVTTLDGSSSKRSCIKTGNKCKKSIRRRKQEHNSIDICQKSPNWNIHTFVDDQNEINNCKKEKRIRPGIKKPKRRNKLPALETKKQKENLLPPISHDISTEFTTEFHVVPYLGETKPIDLQDSIDFSSNEIFSNYDFTEYTVDFNKTFNSSNTIYDSEICEKEYDMNGNEVDTYEIQYSTLSECCSKNDKKPNYSLNPCCSYCHEDCAAHWIAISEQKNMVSAKDRVLSDNIVMNDSEINRQAKFDCSYLTVVEDDINSTSEFLNEKYNENNSHLPIPNIPDIDTFNEKCNENSLYLLNEECNENNLYTDTPNMPEIVSQYKLENAELSSTESTISCIENIEEGILKELTEIENAECNMYNDINDDFLHQLDLAITSLESKEMDALQAQVYTEEAENNDELQCLLCPLTFFSARTMAMHQAGAHGGISSIAVA